MLICASYQLGEDITPLSPQCVIYEAGRRVEFTLDCSEGNVIMHMKCLTYWQFIQVHDNCFK